LGAPRLASSARRGNFYWPKSVNSSKRKSKVLRLCGSGTLARYAPLARAGLFDCASIHILAKLSAMPEISYELTQKDFTESFVAHRNRRPVVAWARRIGLSVMVFGLILMVQGAIRTGNVTTLMPLFVAVALLLAYLSGLPSRLSARKQFQKQPGAHGTRTVTFDDVGAHWRWNGGSSDVEWKNYVRSVEGVNQVLLYTSPACFNILPKRAIPSEDMDTLREFLKHNIRSGK